MAPSRRRGRPRVTLVFLVLLSITVITLDFRGDGGGVVGRIRDGASDAFAPVRDGADAVLSPVGDAFSGITGYGSLKDENDRLRRRVAELEGEEFAGLSAIAELAELKEALGLDEVLGDARRVAATVIGSPVGNFEQTITLDKGTRDGVDVDMPVVTGAGLVGRVIRASGRQSVVRLITDPASSVGVRLVGSGEAGIAEGEGEDRDLSVGYVSEQTQVAIDELVETSGLEGGSDLYPPHIPVGKVTLAEKHDGELDMRVRIAPVADLEHLVYVQVVITR
ncbi:MAG: rod shape-determining protein MreC [Acidimicrobiia bacterium]